MDNAKKILIQADFLRKTNWLKSVKLLKDGIKKYPKEKSLILAISRIYTNHKMHRKALEMYLRALSLDSKNHDILFQVGNCFLAMKEYKLAIDYYGKIHSNEFPELIYNKAFAYSKLSKIETSISLLESLIEKAPLSEIPYLFVSELYFSKKDFHSALRYLILAEKKFGKKSSLHYLKGAAYSHMEMWLNSYCEFQEADKFNVNFPHFYRSFGVSAEKIGKTDLAVKLLEKNLEKEPKDSLTYIELIKIYIAHNELEKAYKIIQDAQNSIPFSFPLTILYNQIIQKLKNKDTYGSDR